VSVVFIIGEQRTFINTTIQENDDE
jgi:hypothetical protein